MLAQDADKKAYRKAYEYIARDPMLRNTNFIISDSLIHLHKPMFWSYLKHENENDSIARIRVDSIYYAQKHFPTHSPILEQLRKEKTPNESATHIIYFSKISDERIFVAEVLAKTDDSEAYRNQTKWNNNGYIYLIFLNDRQSVRRAIKRPMRYMHISSEKDFDEEADNCIQQK